MKHESYVESFVDHKREPRAIEREMMGVHPLPSGTVVFEAWEGGVSDAIPALFIAFVMFEREVESAGVEQSIDVTPQGKRFRKKEIRFPDWRERLDSVGNEFADVYGDAFIFLQSDDFERPWLQLGQDVFWTLKAAQEAMERKKKLADYHKAQVPTPRQPVQ